jgi:hypothetical protein
MYKQHGIKGGGGESGVGIERGGTEKISDRKGS